MLEQLFTKLEEHAKQVCRTSVVKADQEPDDVYYLSKPDGEYERVVAEPPPRNLIAGSVPALCHVIADWKADGYLPCVWYNRAQVVGCLNVPDRREWITYDLAYTKALKTVQELDRKEEWLDQKAFLKLLRIPLHGCIDDGLISTCREIRFSSSSSGTGSVQTGKASLTAEMKAELSGVGQIPETVDLDVQIFEEPEFTATIACAMELDPDKSKFALVPLPGEVEKAIRYAEAKIGELIETRLTARLTAKQLDAPPVYYGTPNQVSR